MELFIIHVKFAIYYFLHFNTVRQVAARLRAKSAIYDFLVTLMYEMSPKPKTFKVRFRQPNGFAHVKGSENVAAVVRVVYASY